MTPYVYVMVRKDLTLEQQMVQLGHAALEAGYAFDGPRNQTAHLVLLEVPDQPALQAAASRLERHGIEHALFYEPDFGMGHSALATRPVTERHERQLFRKYPLYRQTPGGAPG